MKDIILTIDTEGPRGSDPVLYQIWGKVGNDQYYGIPKIIEVCDRYNIRALFFVDIPEIWDCGYDKIKEVVLFIKEKGHDVGMHVHPHHMPNETRHFLFDYTKEEQYDIIKKCTDKFVEICGEAPESFRAGKYGANRDTLDIIAELGYKYDFSEFYSNKWCGIKPEIAYILPQVYKTIIEYPVTIFKSIELWGHMRYDKLEVTNDYHETCHILKQYSETDKNEVITLFMHSFSLINYLDTPDNPTINYRNLRNFENTLDIASRISGIRFISEADLAKCLKTEVRDSEEYIITTKGLLRQLYFTCLRAYEIRKYNKKARKFFMVLWGVIATVILILILIIITL